MIKAGTHIQKLSTYLVMAVFALVPLHAFLTVWASTAIGHYTVLRLWDDGLLAILSCIAVYWLVSDKALRGWFLRNPIIRLILLYGALTILLGAVSLAKGDVTMKALSYGILINLRYLVWFVAVALCSQRSSGLLRSWHVLVLAPAAVVVLFGVLQYTILPHNFLSHFGYRTATTIAPIETINHNPHYIRIQSTLRGANPLGAYLVVVLAALAAPLLRNRRRLACTVFGLAGLLVLYASGSRSAWIGSVLAVAVAVLLSLKSVRAKQLFGMIALGLVVVASGAVLLLKNNAGLENALLHTQKNSAVRMSSNAAHASALKAGLKDVVHQPFGDGPGSAGPASVYNAPHPTRIAEDYYVQIAQETGWIGLGLFMGILLLVAAALYRRSSSPLALVALASLIGISFVNLLSHAWADDTLAFVWWGLAAMALVEPKADSDEV